MVRIVKRLLAVLWLNKVVSQVISVSGFLAKYKLHLLSTHYDPRRRTPLDKPLYQSVLRHWLDNEYYPERDPVVREKKKAILIESGSSSWAATYDKEPFDLIRCLPTGQPLGEAVPLYRKLKSCIENSAQRENSAIVQIGVASGRELAWFAQQFPGIKCIGTDAFSGAVNHARERYKLPNLEFQLLALERANDLLEEYRNKHIFLYTSGLFHFVQPEFVDSFFKYISTLQDLDLCISEPVSLPWLDIEAFPKNSTPRTKPLSWTHNYPYLLKKNNLRIQEFILTDHPYDYHSMKFTSVNCFIWGKPLITKEIFDYRL